MNQSKKKTLGRGLSALLGPEVIEEGATSKEESLAELHLERIVPSQFQPRKDFNQEELDGLSVSIKEKGVLQPVLVRPHPEKPGYYELIAGERRWRAAQQAGLNTIPVYIRKYTNAEAVEAALLENIQRQDLNPIEEAQAFKNLIEAFGHTQESLAQNLGKSRSYIANSVRLLHLPSEVISYVKEGKLTAGQAKNLIGKSDAKDLAEQIIRENLTVRQIEGFFKKRNQNKNLHSSSSTSGEVSTNQDLDEIKNQLSELLQMKVDLTSKGYGGKVTIFFESPKELDYLLQLFYQFKNDLAGRKEEASGQPAHWI